MMGKIMRQSYPVLFSTAALLMLLSACDQNGGGMPIDAQKFLSGLDGPKIPSMQENQLEAAKSAEKNDDFKQASQIYEQILEKDPDTTDVVQLLADSLRRGGEYDKAISVYDGILTKDEGNVAAKEGKALALMAKGDFETPTILLEEVLKVDGTRWKSLNAMGILFVTRGLYPDSMKYFDEALKQSPNNIAVMNNLGLSQALNKQYDLAVDTLLKASTLSTVGSTGRKRIDLNTALVYASAGKLPESRRIAEQYLSGPSLDNNLGLYAHLAKDDSLAKSYLNMALTESKTYYEKAWDNLEALNNKDDIKDNSKTEKADEKATEKPTTEKKSEGKKSKKGKPAAARDAAKDKDKDKDKSAKITVVQEPDATKAEVKPISEIIAHEIKDDKSANKAAAPASSPVLPDVDKLKAEPATIMPNEINQDNAVVPPAVDNVIDNMTKPAEPKTVTVGNGMVVSPEKGTVQSLGTIKIPVKKAHDKKEDDSADDSENTVEKK